LETTIDYDASLPFETVQKQPLAMSKFLFSGRQLTTPYRHSILISEWQHIQGKRTVNSSNSTGTTGQLQSVVIGILPFPKSKRPPENGCSDKGTGFDFSLFQ
jgi:hypothetical protein